MHTLLSAASNLLHLSSTARLLLWCFISNWDCATFCLTNYSVLYLSKGAKSSLYQYGWWVVLKELISPPNNFESVLIFVLSQQSYFCMCPWTFECLSNQCKWKVLYHAKVNIVIILCFYNNISWISLWLSVLLCFQGH